MTWKAFLEKKPWSGTVNLRLARKRIGHMGGFDVVQPFTFKSYREGDLIPDEEIAIAGMGWADDGEVHDFLRAIVDLAWSEGIKPTALEDQRNELKAVRDHLADMRSLAMRPLTPPQATTDG